MAISIHWGGAGDSGTRIDWDIYIPPPEHGRTIHCNSSYHGLVSGGGAEAGGAALAEMVGAARSTYPRDKSGARGRGYGGRDRVVGFRGREIFVYRRYEVGQTTRGTREYQENNRHRINYCSM